jgi:sortase A
MKAFIGLERILLIFGLALLSVYAVVRFSSVVYSRAEVRQFWRAQSALSGSTTSETTRANTPDFRLWSEQRIAAYKASLSGQIPTPLGLLKIAVINLEVPLLPGTDDVTLNLAVGHIEGTSAPGTNGNVGIAGHRDGFFRALKDIRQGDSIDLISQKVARRYVVDEILVVSPDDVSVLRPRAKPSLTLVTCYPFYFVGSAPQRFIVHASAEDATTHTTTGKRAPLLQEKEVGIRIN